MSLHVPALPLAPARTGPRPELAAALAAAAALLVAAPPAEACSCARQCCGRVWVTPQGDRIPSNVPGFSWWPGLYRPALAA